MAKVYQSGKSNLNADALSWWQPLQKGKDRMRSKLNSTIEIESLLNSEPVDFSDDIHNSFGTEQPKDASLNEIIQFLETNKLPSDETCARKIALQVSLFGVVDGIVMFVDPKRS